MLAPHPYWDAEMTVAPLLRGSENWRNVRRSANEVDDALYTFDQIFIAKGE